MHQVDATPGAKFSQPILNPIMQNSVVRCGYKAVGVTSPPQCLTSLLLLSFIPILIIKAHTTTFSFASGFMNNACLVVLRYLGVRVDGGF